jgi:hypothetical protein
MDYRIQVKGHLDSAWSEWFEGMTIIPLDQGDSLLVGELVDQAALHGLLSKLRDLGLPLLAVNRGAPTGPDPLPTLSKGEDNV